MPLPLNIQDLFTRRVVEWEGLEFKEGWNPEAEECEPVEVQISPEELAVLSFPGADRSIALADLRRGKTVARRYRNRRIGEFLKELDLTEGRAAGIPKILRAIRANGSPLPKFETDEDRTTFLIRLPVHRAALAIEPLSVTAPVTDPVTDPLQRLLLTLTAGELPPSVIQRKVGIKPRPTFRQNYLRVALARDYVEPTIPDKPNSRLQKYRLTAKGRTWLEQTGRA